MDLSDLHIFRSVVEAGGVTRAAEKLNRVQSNVTTRGLLRLGTGESTAAMRLPVPMNEYLSRYPEVTFELRTGNTKQLAAAVLSGELDAALASEPIADGPFEKVAIYEEELVIIAAADHPPIKSPRDARPQTVLAFEAGCAYRQRLEDWFAHHGEMPGRIVEITSYHAMLGCAVAGMGIALMPRNVLTTFPDAKLLSTHSLPAALARAQTARCVRRTPTIALTPSRMRVSDAGLSTTPTSSGLLEEARTSPQVPSA